MRVGGVAGRSKALVLGTSLKGRAFESHLHHHFSPSTLQHNHITHNPSWTITTLQLIDYTTTSNTIHIPYHFETSSISHHTTLHPCLCRWQHLLALSTSSGQCRQASRLSSTDTFHLPQSQSLLYTPTVDWVLQHYRWEMLVYPVHRMHKLTLCSGGLSGIWRLATGCRLVKHLWRWLHHTTDWWNSLSTTPFSVGEWTLDKH